MAVIGEHVDREERDGRNRDWVTIPSEPDVLRKVLQKARKCYSGLSFLSFVGNVLI